MEKTHGNPADVNDDNVPPLPESKTSRGANRWLSAEEELKAFQIDPRFEVNLFAGEEQFPEIACPIQIRWDSERTPLGCVLNNLPSCLPRQRA